MRYVTAFCLFILLSGRSSEAQVLPTSNGSCAISASGSEDCNSVSAITLRKAGTTKTTDTPADSRPKLFVTRFILASGAPLDSQAIVGGEVLIVGRNNGEVMNEKKSPPSHINVYDGSVMLMSKEPYLVRNIGKESIELLVIEVRE
jgi:hypothetical protein